MSDVRFNVLPASVFAKFPTLKASTFQLLRHTVEEIHSAKGVETAPSGI